MTSHGTLQRLTLDPKPQGAPKHMIDATCYAFFWDEFQVGGVVINVTQITVLSVVCWALCEVEYVDGREENRLCGFVLTKEGLVNVETMEHFKGFADEGSERFFVEKNYKQLKFEAP